MISSNNNMAEDLCETCKFKKTYTTGFDEYPAYTALEYCAKGHWENGPPEPDFKIEECKEYIKK